jgi:PAS domain S-box-containing protein
MSQPGKLRILFVEDEVTLGRHLAQELSDEYVVDIAANGIEALQAVMRRKPDLIVTDIVMPMMNGVELLKILRAEPGTQALPVLLISGLAEEAQRIEGFREGADGYLAKPYSVRELRALVGSMLQGADQRAQAARKEAREQAEQLALAERAALLESITDAFYALDRQLRFTYVNRRALDYFQRSREALLGKGITEVFAVLAGSPLEAHLQRALAEQRSVAFELPSPIVGQWAEFHVYPTGQGLAVYFRDISDRKRAETELRRAQDSLRESDRRKNEFLALLAHELRNPLAPIGNGLQVLRLRAASADPLAGRTLDIMERQLDHLVRLVDDLLDVARITQGKLQLRVQPVLLTDVVTAAVESTRGLMEAHEHQLALHIQAPDLVVQGDQDRLVQVFANLLANSAKYTDPCGKVVLTLDRQGEQAVVAVCDNGIGIAPESLEQVFEMFSQLGEHSVQPSEGLGIGLALVQRLVQLHGGTVSAQSAGRGKGSTFTVRLPLAGSRPDVLHPAGDDHHHWSAVRSAGRRVLVVDDNADAASSLQLLLQLLGYEVLTAPDGEQAIECAKAQQPHIIFMDIGLPGLDGVEAARRILASPQMANTSIVALTGWGQSTDRERTRAAGMVAHLVKPVGAQALKDVLVSIAGPETSKRH